MTLQPIPIESFGGLDLDRDPGDVGWSGAIDILDVDLDRPGLLRERDRFKTLVANTSLTAPSLLSWSTFGFMASTAASIKLYDLSGGLVGTAVAPTQYSGGSHQAFGTPTTSYMYLADASATYTIRRLDTSGAISAPTGMPRGRFLTSSPNDNRLVTASVDSNTSRVLFSNPGLAEVWGEIQKAVTGTAATGVFDITSHGYNVGDAVYFLPSAGGSGITAGLLYYVTTVPTANTFTVSTTQGGSTFTFSTNLTAGVAARNNDYVDLDPGDGDSITGIATWRELLFVFKSTKFFVFYGTTTDSRGNAIFNYRAYRAGIGTTSQIAVGDDGVYFHSASGGPRGEAVWHTTGGDPTLISQQISRALNGTAPATFTPGSSARGGFGLAFANGRLFVQTTSYLWVFDTNARSWTLYDVTGLGSIAPFDNAGWLIAATTAASAPVHKLDPTYSGTDSLRTPTPRYRSGFSDLGSPDMKRIRQWRLQGTGTPTFSASHDFGSLETGAAVTLGTAPATAEGRYRVARRGRQFSFQISGTSTWSVNNVVADVADKRTPGSYSST